MKYILGIDTGLYGAMATLDMQMNFVSVKDMPILLTKKGKKTRKIYDVTELKNYIISLSTDDYFVIIEKTRPMSRFIGGQPAANWFLGAGYMLFIGMLEMRGFRYEVVEPRTWQQSYFKGLSDGTKVLSHQFAQRLFPTAELKTSRGRVLDGRADAILIAEFGRRRLTGNQSEQQIGATV